jgi:hypothetical protein
LEEKPNILMARAGLSAMPAQYDMDSHRRTHKAMYVCALEGSMVFDEDDIQNMRNQGEELWTSIILHEMGHFLSIGTLWWYNGLQSFAGSQGNDDDSYVGLIAPAKREEIGCSGNVPVETDGAAGNAGAHWDEACMGEELKTSYANSKILFPKSRLDRWRLWAMMESTITADPFGLDNLIQGQCGDHCTEATTGDTFISIGNTQRSLKKREQLSKHGEREMLLFAA